MLRYISINPTRPIRNRYFDDPPAENEGDSAAAAAAAAALAAKNNKGEEKKFSQAEVDRIVQQRVKKKDEERTELLSQLDSLRQQGLTPENQQALEARIEALQNEGKTKEQLAQEERGKLEKKHKSELDKLGSESKSWRGRYETYKSQTEIMTAAASHKAHNATQIYNILRPDTVMEEEVGEDGKPTGEFVPKVNFRDVVDGKPVVLKLNVTDAIKRMTEMPDHMNLFDSGANAGLGGRNNGRSGGGNTAVPTNTSAYMEARKKNRNLIKEGTKA